MNRLLVMCEGSTDIPVFEQLIGQGGEVPEIMFDSRELLRVAIENVLRNALRHTPSASSVTVELLQAGDRVSLSVYDQGPGVLESDLPRLFEPFFRSEDARSNYPGGTGLGLAMTRRIVEKHGGSVAAQNQETGGLVVTMVFPFNEPSSAMLHDSLHIPDAATDALGVETQRLSGGPN